MTLDEHIDMMLKIKMKYGGDLTVVTAVSTPDEPTIFYELHINPSLGIFDDTTDEFVKVPKVIDLSEVINSICLN